MGSFPLWKTDNCNALAVRRGGAGRNNSICEATLGCCYCNFKAEFSMAIVRCPRCRDEVTGPRGAPSRARVRCPLCWEQYLLSEALASAPPLLVIIGGEVPQAAMEQSA